uniref:Uncharacterized protein n=1 Tax=Ditylenchus dipsaci TaxID=166011 RepID=A0A915D169_9BILA
MTLSNYDDWTVIALDSGDRKVWKITKGDEHRIVKGFDPANYEETSAFNKEFNLYSKLEGTGIAAHCYSEKYDGYQNKNIIELYYIEKSIEDYFG